MVVSRDLRKSSSMKCRVNTPQRTITYPTERESRKIIGSKVIFDGIWYVFFSSPQGNRVESIFSNCAANERSLFGCCRMGFKFMTFWTQQPLRWSEHLEFTPDLDRFDMNYLPQISPPKKSATNLLQHPKKNRQKKNMAKQQPSTSTPRCNFCHLPHPKRFRPRPCKLDP